MFFKLGWSKDHPGLNMALRLTRESLKLPMVACGDHHSLSLFEDTNCWQHNLYFYISKSKCISWCKNFVNFAKKIYFFYFTHLFLQNNHISLSILHIYSIKYSFFYYFLLFPSPFTLLSSLKILSHTTQATINDQSTIIKHSH